jgi:peroxiredoxin Q/BCP
MTRSILSRHWLAAALLGAAVLFTAPAQAQTLKPGDRAPDFSVMSTTGKPVALGDYLGKKNIVLFFYIAAFTDT